MRHVRAGHGGVWPLDLHRVALEQAREIKAVFGEDVPLADVGWDNPDVTHGLG